MTLTDEILQRIPADIHQHPDVILLRDTIRIHGFQELKDLVTFIDEDIAAINSWLKNNDSTGLDTVKLMGVKVARLGKLRAWKAWCEL